MKLMKSSKNFWGVLATAALTIAIGAGCGNDVPTAVIAPFQPEIVNTTDSFSFQITAAENVTTVASYTWANTGTIAVINHATNLDSGTAAITILDSAGAQVYTNGLVASLNENTLTGIAGDWTIQVAFLNAYGAVNFTVQKF